MSDLSPSIDYPGGEAMFAPPIAVIASSDAAFERARSAVVDSGAQAVRCDAGARRPPVWIELDGEPTAILADYLGRLDDVAGEAGLAAVISAPREALDAVVALVSSPAVEILIAPDAIERACAAAMLAAWSARPSQRAFDAASDPEPGGLRQLSEEVARIAETLARLSDGPGAGGKVKDRLAPMAAGPVAKVDRGLVRAAIRERRLRARYFDSDLFADPAWDMLLDLFSAELAKEPVPVSSLCVAADVPPTTALRWIRALTDKRLFERNRDPADARRVFIRLSRSASGQMRGYFTRLAQLRQN